MSTPSTCSVPLALEDAVTHYAVDACHGLCGFAKSFS